MRCCEEAACSAQARQFLSVRLQGYLSSVLACLQNLFPSASLNHTGTWKNHRPIMKASVSAASCAQLKTC